MAEGLTTSWLAARLAVDPMRLHALRRSGELLAYRPPGASDYLFPAWQFDEAWRPLPVVPLIVAAARREGLTDERLEELLDARVGLAGGERLRDLARAGDAARVLDVLRGAGTG